MAQQKKISFLRKLASAAGNGKGAAITAPDGLAEAFPALVEYMTAVSWPDGSERETSTLTLIIEDGRCKACINDKANERSLWRSGDSFILALEALEAAVADERAEWRRWAQPRSGRGGKK